MRHVVLVALLGTLVPLPPAAEAQEARPRIRRERQDMPRPAARTPPPAEDPAPVASSTTPVIAADGAVETVMPDGSTRRAKPGDCGWTIVHPDGQKNTIACLHVQRVNLPVPDNASAAWLVSHGDLLLTIARTLLGGNAASIDNYLKTVESEQPGVYERILLRTDLIVKLTGQ